MESVLARLKQKGQKLTPKRQAILRILMASKKPMTALEVRQKVQKDHPQVSLNTVYLNLLMLSKMELALQTHLHSGASARFEYQGEGSHHHHAVCMDCGDSFCLKNVAEPKAQAPAEDQDFQFLGHTLEFYGRCSACLKKIKPIPDAGK